MKRKTILLISIFIVLIILITSGIFAYKIISKDINDEEKKKITYTKPTEPYGFNYLNEWQKNLYRTLESDTLEIGTYYELDEEKDLSYVKVVIDLYNKNNPVKLPKTYGAIENIMPMNDHMIGTETTNRIYIGQWLYSDWEKEKGKLEEIEKKADEIISLIPKNADDFEKIKIIYDYLVENVEYDYESYYYLESGLANDDFTESGNAYGALINGKAICCGIAKALYYVANKADIYILYVDSVSRNHAWNMVWLDGKFYRLDATWHGFLTYDNYEGEYVKGIPLPSTAHTDRNP